MNITGGTLTTTGGPVDAVAWRAGHKDSAHVALTVRRLSGTDPFDFKLQGAWADSSDDDDWVDTKLVTTGLDSDSIVRVGGVDQMVWACYRVQLDCSGACEVGYRFVNMVGASGLDERDVRGLAGGNQQNVSIDTSGNPVILYPWGIDGGGDPYYDPYEGAVHGEEAVLNSDLTVTAVVVP